jgi:hypothetical protein
MQVTLEEEVDLEVGVEVEVVEEEEVEEEEEVVDSVVGAIPNSYCPCILNSTFVFYRSSRWCPNARGSWWRPRGTRRSKGSQRWRARWRPWW